MNNYLEDVRSQYEDYPYPRREPADENQRLVATITEALDRINYYCFEGKQDFTNNFRILVAGGGTGDAVIFLAEQLRETNAEIVYLDISTVSMAIARERARVRGLDNITWMNHSLLDLPSLGLGLFDYVNCSGVLHHLVDPEAGLLALKSALKDSGVMMLMVYGTYGRTGVYQMQDIMRLVNQGVSGDQEKVDNCKRVLGSLPQTNWFVANTAPFLEDIEQYGDVGIYDLFLHSQDRAYTIPELYSLVEQAELDILQLFPSLEPQGNRLYDPTVYTDDPAICSAMLKLPLKEQQAVAEMLHGRINKHTFYVAPQTRTRPQVTDLDNIPFLSMSFGEDAYRFFYQLAKTSRDMIEFHAAPPLNLGIKFQKTAFSEELFKNLDGKRTLRQIFSKVINRSRSKHIKVTEQQLLDEFSHIYNAFNLYDWMLLRSEEVGPFASVGTLEQRMSKRCAEQGKETDIPPASTG